MIKVALKFGAFVVVCLAFTGYLAFTIGNIDLRDPLARDTFDLTAAFDDATGLLVNDNVKIAGVVVGKVTGVTTEAGRAVVSMQIDDEHADLPTDTAASIRWRNLIGQRYVYLHPGDAPQALADGDEIVDTTSVIDLGELFNRLGPIVGAIDPAQVNDFLETVTQALEGREDKVGQTLDDLATLMSGLAGRDQAISRLVTNLDTVAATINRRDAQIEVMLENLVDLAAAFGDNTATLDAAMVELSAFGTELSRLLDANADEIDRLLGNLAQVTDTVRGRLPELDAALAALGDANAAVFRAGNRGEMLNQKILCVVVPGVASSGSCPTPVLKGLHDPAADATVFTRPSASGASAISSILGRLAQP